jgi:anaerobic selenocysteine-containing dehydrogenase
MVIVSLDSPSCEVPCWILLSVVYGHVTRQAKELHHLKHVGALERGLAYLSRCNSGWFCHRIRVTLPDYRATLCSCMYISI